MNLIPFPNSMSANVDVVADAAQLVSRLRSRIPETDRLARLPDETVADLDEAGMFKLLVPARRGGLQLDMPTFMDVLVELGRGDISAAWTVNILNCGAWFLTVMFPEHVQDQVYASANPRVANVLHPRKATIRNVPGGKLIEHGVWGFNSGVMHAGWDLLGIPITDEDGAVVDHALALLPISDVRILDDWDTIGVRGSGSSTVEVRDVFVPEERYYSLSKTMAGDVPFVFDDGEFQYRQSFEASVVLLSITVLGGCDAAIELFMDKVGRRGIQHSHYAQAAAAPPVHLAIGEATAKIQAAKLLAKDVLTRMDSAARAGRSLTHQENVELRRNGGLVAKLAWEGVDLLAEASGASMMVSGNLLNRIWRDVRTGSLHAAHLPATMFENYGRMVCGVENTPAVG